LLDKFVTKDEYLNPFFIAYGDPSRDWTTYAADAKS
jgi:hypothetical protein